MQTKTKQLSLDPPKVVFKGFNISRLARRLGVGRSNFYLWSVVPLDYVMELEAMTGVSRHRQRPDYYGPEPGENKK